MTCPIKYNLDQCSSKEYGLMCDTCIHYQDKLKLEKFIRDNSGHWDLNYPDVRDFIYEYKKELLVILQSIKK